MKLPHRSLTWWIVAVGSVAIGVSAVLAVIVVVGEWTAAIPDLIANAPTADALRISRPLPVHDDYVGSQACQECHAAQFASFQTHPMSRSAGWMTDLPPIENYTHATVKLPGGRAYTAAIEEGKAVHHETFTDLRGEQVYDMAMPIGIGVGSGQRGRSYLLNQNGALYLSPLTWYSTRQRWAMTPGYSINHNPRFSRRIIDACINCHVGRVHRVPGRNDFFPVPTLVEASIGCERCHGPAARHIRYQQDAQFAAALPGDPIINPGKLDPPRRESVCLQCHFEGVDRILQYGCEDFDFRPGQLFSDVWTAFYGGSGIAAGGTKAVSQVEQMRLSKCYVATGGQLGCISCHDPHSSPTESETDAYFRGRCLQCHESKSPCSLPPAARATRAPNDDCTTCHMPKLAATDVPHTSQTDHRILRDPAKSPAEPPVAIGEPSIFDDQSGPVPPAVAQRARGLLFAKRAERERDLARAADALDLLLPLAEANRDDLEVVNAIGVCYWVKGEYQRAEQFWDYSLSINGSQERVLGNLVAICQESGANEAALEYVNALISLNPTRPELFGRRAHILGRLSRFDEGIQSAQTALEMDPAIATAHGWLAEVYSQQGQAELSQGHRALFHRLMGRSADADSDAKLPPSGAVGNKEK